LNSKKAFSNSWLSNLKNVIFIWKWVFSSINCKCDFWKRFNSSAVLFNCNSSNQWVNNLFWSYQEWSSWINDSLVFWSINNFVSLRDWV
jgi:hypothetical protein